MTVHMQALHDDDDDDARCTMPICCQHEERQRYFASSLEIKLMLSSQAVQANLVGVGTLLYLDLQHPAIPDEIKKELRFSQQLGGNVPLLRPGSNGSLHGKNIKKFQQLCVQQEEFYPVVQCMLLYEMPESVVAHNDYCDIESQVWVGIRQVMDWKSKHKYITRYLTVPTKALVSLEKLQVVGMSLAVFESCVK